MQKKKKTPRPVKPPRQEWRPAAGFCIRVTIEPGVPVPRFIQDMVKKGV